MTKLSLCIRWGCFYATIWALKHKGFNWMSENSIPNDLVPVPTTNEEFLVLSREVAGKLIRCWVKLANDLNLPETKIVQEVTPEGKSLTYEKLKKRGFAAGSRSARKNPPPAWLDYACAQALLNHQFMPATRFEWMALALSLVWKFMAETDAAHDIPALVPSGHLDPELLREWLEWAWAGRKEKLKQS